MAHCVPTSLSLCWPTDPTAFGAKRPWVLIPGRGRDEGLWHRSLGGRARAGYGQLGLGTAGSHVGTVLIFSSQKMGCKMRPRLSHHVQAGGVTDGPTALQTAAEGFPDNRLQRPELRPPPETQRSPRARGAAHPGLPAGVRSGLSSLDPEVGTVALGSSSVDSTNLGPEIFGGKPRLDMWRFPRLSFLPRQRGLTATASASPTPGWPPGGSRSHRETHATLEAPRATLHFSVGVGWDWGPDIEGTAGIPVSHLLHQVCQGGGGGG